MTQSRVNVVTEPAVRSKFQSRLRKSTVPDVVSSRRVLRRVVRRACASQRRPPTVIIMKCISLRLRTYERTYLPTSVRSFVRSLCVGVLYCLCQPPANVDQTKSNGMLCLWQHRRDKIHTQTRKTRCRGGHGTAMDVTKESKSGLLLIKAGSASTRSVRSNKNNVLIKNSANNSQN